jgi:hypothetical protein
MQKIIFNPLTGNFDTIDVAPDNPMLVTSVSGDSVGRAISATQFLISK